MSKITVGIFDEHIIVQEALCSLLSLNDDFAVLPVPFGIDKTLLIEKIKTHEINILVINLHNPDSSIFDLISQLTISYPKVKILVLSRINDEEIVLKTIKAGAKGLLDTKSGKNELVEAIYSLRNGYDYYSQSIGNLLLNNYLGKVKTKVSLPDSGIDSLSSRQVEILKLWGNGLSNKEIADKLFISVRTVESHKNHIMQKLNFKTTIDMIKFGIRNNLIKI